MTPVATFGIPTFPKSTVGGAAIDLSTVSVSAIDSTPVSVSTIDLSTVETVMFKTFAFEPAPVEITYILSFEIGAIVFVINPVTEVAVPYGVVIISIPGEFVFIHHRCGRI